MSNFIIDFRYLTAEEVKLGRELKELRDVERNSLGYACAEFSARVRDFKNACKNSLKENKQ